MTDVYVLYESASQDTSVPDPNDSWDRASTSTSHTIIGISLDKDSGYSGYKDALSVPFEVVEGKDYYLLYYVYSTGDSFGHDEDARIDFVGLYETDEIPLENLKRIEEDKPAPGKYGDYSIELLNSKGEIFIQHANWRGYFESLSYARIEPVQLSKGNRYTYRPERKY